MTGLTSGVLALAAWCSALLGRWVGLNADGVVAGMALGMTAVVVLALLVMSVRASGDAGRRRAVVALGILALASTTGVGACLRAQHVVAGPLAVRMGLSTEGTAGVGVRLVAVAVGDPQPQQSGGWWWMARLVSIEAPRSWASSSRERVVVRSHDAVPLGARVAVDGLVAVVEGSGAPWLQSLGVVLEIRASSVRVRAPPPGWIQWTTTVRDRLASAADRHLQLTHATLLSGLVTGDASRQPQELADAVDAAGLSHLVAVSGSNVALVVAGAMALVLAVGGGRRAAWRTSLVVVWWFVILVRAEPSVVRAALMTTLVLVALLKGRPRDAGHLLGMAVVLALLIDPMLAARVGFILSVAATWGVLTITPRLVDVLMGPAWFRTAVAATIGAQVPVAPVLLLIGGTVSAASLPANIVAVPAAAVASVIGAVAGVVAVVSLPIAGLVAALAGPALAVVVWSARTFAGTTGDQVSALAPWVAGVATLAVSLRWLVGVLRLRWPDLGVGGWGGSGGRSPRGVRTVVAVVVVLAVPVAAAVGMGPSDPGPARMIALDVGQGDAVLIADGAGRWMLVDGGPDRGLLRRGLRRHGVHALEAVVITHSHADHDGGLVDLFGWIDVGLVVVGPAAGEPGVSPAVAQATVAGVPVQQVHAGMSWRLGSVDVRVLSPPATGIADDANESSLVLRVQPTAGRSALLTGDAEVIAQTRMLATPAAIDVDVLKVPHHGGNTNAEGFLAATTPEVAVISAGAGNPFGHPHPDVLTDLAGIEVRRTDQSGDVVIALD